MKRIVASAAAFVMAAGIGLAALSSPAGAAFDPAYGNCNTRGGHLAAALYNQGANPADRNGDGVVCMYLTHQGDFRFADNHVSKH